MTGDEKLTATAVQLLEAKIREIRPQFIDAVTRGLGQVDRFHVTEAVDEWLLAGPDVVRRAHEACWAAHDEMTLAEEIHEEGQGQ